MKWKSRVLIIVILASLLLMSGCNLFSKKEKLSLQDQASTNVAETFEAMYSIETIVAMTLVAEKNEQATQDAIKTLEAPPPTATDTAIPTDTMVPTPVYTSTFSVPMVSVSVPTNCRIGPGAVYDQVSVLMTGMQAEVVARNAEGTYWVIRNPGGTGMCWLWGYYATVVGPVGSLPVWDPPPTPTPAATITAAPSTYSTGALAIERNYTADLDEGLLNGGPGKDVKYTFNTLLFRSLTPINGAKFKVHGQFAPSMYDCLEADLSTDSILLLTFSEGTYVCYKTNEGRPGVFRFNGYEGEKIKIGYTTWNIP